MRYIVFFATTLVVTLSTACFASPLDSRPVGQSAINALTEGASAKQCSYSSLGTCNDCVDDCCDTACDSGCGCGTSGCCRGGCGCCCGDWRERAASAGLIAGYEFLWLKPQFSEGVNYESTTGPGQDNHYFTESYGFPSNYSMAPRVWLGYQLCSGFAARVRYWQYDQGFGQTVLEGTSDHSYYAPSQYGEFFIGNGSVLAVQNGMDVDVVDLDLTQDFNWCHTRLSLGGGIAYAGLRMDRRLEMARPQYNDQRVEERAVRFEGIGPTVLAELKRQIRESNFFLVGGARGTVLFGREKTQIYDLYIYNLTVTEYSYGMTTNRCRGILTGWIGVQYDREISTGPDLFARLSWEGQYWNGFGSPVSTFGDLAFQGLGVSVGLRR